MSSGKHKLANNLRSHSASLTAKSAAMISVYVHESSTSGCFLLAQDVKEPKVCNKTPVIPFLSLVMAQLASDHRVRLGTMLGLDELLKTIVPLRYFNTSLARSTSSAVALSRNLERAFTAYPISGLLVSVVYCSEPMRLAYYVQMHSSAVKSDPSSLTVVLSGTEPW